MDATTTSRKLSDAEHSAQLRKAVIAATVGTTIEWYDFFLYGTAAGLVFAKLFFPNADPLTGTLAGVRTYFVGFVGRPIGAAIFGHYGDRIGRKATLIATLLVMGIATFLVAFVPTYDSIGIWGAVILTVLRIAARHRRRRRMGRLGADVDGMGARHMAARAGRLLAAIRRAVRAVPGQPRGPRLQRLVRRPDFATWGWRIPFLLSIVLVGVGLWIRLGILETPVFQQLLDEQARSSARRSSR